MTYLEQIKSVLSINDHENDEALNTIINLMIARLQTKINKDVVPPELEYIIVEASISRFNRINDEGKTSGSESDVSATWQTDDLAPFDNDIANWLANNNDSEASGNFRFY